jgi:hypothetical protein
VKGLEPIVVIFLEKRDKEAVWLKIRQEENLINQLSYPELDPPPSPTFELMRVVSACASSYDH